MYTGLSNFTNLVVLGDQHLSIPLGISFIGPNIKYDAYLSDPTEAELAEY